MCLVMEYSYILIFLQSRLLGSSYAIHGGDIEVVEMAHNRCLLEVSTFSASSATSSFFRHLQYFILTFCKLFCYIGIGYRLETGACSSFLH